MERKDGVYEEADQSEDEADRGDGSISQMSEAIRLVLIAAWIVFLLLAVRTGQTLLIVGNGVVVALLITSVIADHLALRRA